MRLFVALVFSGCCFSQVELHYQATAVGQEHGGFPSLYEGDNSLPAHSERRVSVTATVFFNWRIGKHWEIVVDPEIAGGRGFGGVTGIAGFPNGEIPRVASATPTLYLARGYVHYSKPLKGGDERAVSVLAGKFAISDFFDANTFSHDPRGQFLNWALMSNGAWDYPADTRGYTVGVMAEWHVPGWSARSAVVMEPTEANGPTLDTRLGRNRGLALEVERDWKIAGQKGALRVLGFDNLEKAGTYREFLNIRRDGTAKYGVGFNLEQRLSADGGVFARYGWNDGKTETWAFTEIDRSVSGGAAWKGRRWGRRGDTVGVGVARNYLSGDHRSFLAAGGYGFIIGDGRLNYRPETAVEAYYALNVGGGWTVTGDYQRIDNPGYNRDRGPVNVGTLRLHWER